MINIGKLRKQSPQKVYEDADILRDAAVYYEKTNNSYLAQTIMEEALKLRPDGPFIKEKVRLYREKNKLISRDSREMESSKQILLRSFYEWKRLKKCKILFHRDYTGYSGGHLKVFDYYKHLIDLGCDVDIFFTKRSTWDNKANVNPWKNETHNIVKDYNPRNYDVLFIEGMDWGYLESGIENEVPVINLVQGFRQTDKKNELLYSFLHRKATRIAVSHEVAESIRETKDANGPIYPIPNGLDLPEINFEKTNDIYIMGKKNPKLAVELEEIFIRMG